MSGVFNLGGMIGAFTGSQLENLNKNQAIQDQLNKTTGGMDQYREIGRAHV